MCINKMLWEKQLFLFFGLKFVITVKSNPLRLELLVEGCEDDDHVISHNEKLII